MKCKPAAAAEPCASLRTALVPPAFPAPARAKADGPDVHRLTGGARADTLNLRRGPGTRYEAIAALPPGRAANPLSRGQDRETGAHLVSLRKTPRLQGLGPCRFIGE
ncbi:MAG: hypothetical protein KDK03_14765 [Rhodobacteraceae bacterium]|nr:hypothetical protein [Paracoccaceae bacterium]